MRKFFLAICLIATPLSLQGCVLAAGVAAGAVVADEISEKDGKFDPLEEAYDGDPTTKPIIDERGEDDDN